MTVHYASLAINLDQRDKNGSPTIHKYPEHGVSFLATKELTNLTVSIIENGSEKDLLTATFYVEPKKVKQNG
jgi:hypothetical protein